MAEAGAPTRPAEVAAVAPDLDSTPALRAALSPCRAADFMHCPLLYRFRVVDRLPEAPAPAAVRGTVVHAVLERLFDLPALERTFEAARGAAGAAVGGAGRGEPGAGEAVPGDAARHAEWLRPARGAAGALVPAGGPDPARAGRARALRRDDAGRRALLRGYVDRLDVAPGGAHARRRLQDRPRPSALLRDQGAVPDAVLRAGAVAAPAGRAPAAAAGLPGRRRGTAVRARRGGPAGDRAQGRALWAAIERAAATGDWRPNPGRLCDWCDHRALCPALGGTPPPLPEPRSERALGPAVTGQDAAATRAGGRVRSGSARVYRLELGTSLAGMIPLGSGPVRAGETQA